MLPPKGDDPRIRDDGKKDTKVKVQKAKGGGRNTESFDPASTLVRPSMRIVVGPNRAVFDKPIKHDDVIIVPEFFCKEDDWDLYYSLVEEMRAVQDKGKGKGKEHEAIVNNTITETTGNATTTDNSNNNNNSNNSNSDHGITAEEKKYTVNDSTHLNNTKDSNDSNETKEAQEAQEAQESKNSEWISWHEGAHLISKNPTGSETYRKIQEKISAYFEIENSKVGTRFNWYRDSSDWKPFHHDSAAFNPQRAKNQNITVGVSFGATRELSFLHAKTGERIYFPQTNGMLFAFGRDVNIHWKHGVNALSAEEQTGKGRISIILWGLAPHVVEEENSPPILSDNTR